MQGETTPLIKLILYMSRPLVWRCRPFATRKGGDTVIIVPEECGVTRVGMLALTCWRSWFFYVTLMVVDLSSKRSNVRRSTRPLSGKSANSVRSQLIACYFCAVIMVIKERKARLQKFLQKLHVQTRVLQCHQTLATTCGRTIS